MSATKEIVVTGRNARARVLAALAKAFPAQTACALGRQPSKLSEYEILSKVNAPTHQIKEAAVPTILEQVELLAKDIDEIEKAFRRKPVDDWSDTVGDQTLDLSDDDEPDDDPDDEDIEKAIPGSKHKFEALTDFVADRGGVPKAKAAETARKEYPEVYASYQSSGLAKNNYRALVEAEIAKGCSVDVAIQKVAYAHPDLARQTIAKAESSPAEFMAKVDLEIQRTGCSRLEAMSRVRKAQPELFKRFQNV